LHLVEAPTNEQQPPPARDEESRHRKEEFPLAIATVHTAHPAHKRRRDMIGESVAKFWAVGSRSEYASRLGV
jgi:hypothetical protein